MRLLKPYVAVAKFALIPLSCRRFLKNKLENGFTRQPNRIVLFFPYASPDCTLQHEFVKQTLILEGISARVIEAEQIDLTAFNQTSSAGLTCHSFDELIASLIRFTGSDFNFSRGVIDEFVRSCSAEVFAHNFTVSQQFLERMAQLRLYAEQVVSHANSIVLADSAYGLNRALRSAAHQQNKAIFALNPHGQWLQLIDRSDEFSTAARFRKILAELEVGNYSNIKQVDTYLEKRFSGTALNDLDSAKVFAQPSSTSYTHLEKKKVLFLHSFRDANSNYFPDNPDELFFPTYFQWADYALKLIAINQQDWYIKPHPSQASYENEEEILSFLLKKHGISSDILHPKLSTRHVLENHWPIYTCSGTIAKEAACFGYYAHTVGDQVPDQISRRARTKLEFERAYTCSIEDAVVRIDQPLLMQAAKALLFEQFSGHGSIAKVISPNRPVLISRDPKDYYFQQLRATSKMIAMLMREQSAIAAHRIGRDIKEAMSTTSVK